ncbi:MAG: hypothetical protein RLZZ618_2900 [Pseudomonadota bacterium]|jgi:signal transduction histidine kinase
MLTAIAEQLFRKRYTLPAVVAAALVLVVVSEITYQDTASTLRGGLSLTDARIATAHLLQLVTDAETAERGFLLTGEGAYLLPYTAAKEALPPVRNSVAKYLEAQGATGQLTAARLSEVTSQTLSEFDQTMALYLDGRRAEALSLFRAGAARHQMLELRKQLEAQLLQSDSFQQHSRDAIFAALLFNRLGVGLLALLSVAAFFVFVHQLRGKDRTRAELAALLATEHDRLEREVASRTAELRELAKHLQTAREDERAHLARELHDELGGLLTAMKLDVARLRQKIGANEELKERLSHLNGSLNDGIALKRRIIEDLRPSALVHLGLKASLENLCSDMALRLAIPVNVDLEAVRLDPATDLAIYRFVQEALTNIGKYADASEVTVSLSHQGATAILQVCDDGVGFDGTVSHAGRHGLSGMRFRAESLGGGMSVSSGIGKGTTLRAVFPLVASEPCEAAAA